MTIVVSNEMTPKDFNESLNKSNLQYSSTSWNGFNLFGDKKSIDELNRLIHLETRVKWLEREYKRVTDSYERY